MDFMLRSEMYLWLKCTLGGTVDRYMEVLVSMEGRIITRVSMDRTII